jgi:hypothetical protein
VGCACIPSLSMTLDLLMQLIERKIISGPRLGLGSPARPLLGGGRPCSQGRPRLYIGMVGMGGWDKPESRPVAIMGVGGAENESTRLQRPPGGRTLHLYPNPKWRLLYPHAVLHPGRWVGKFFSAFHVHYSVYSHDMCLGFSFSVE